MPLLVAPGFISAVQVVLFDAPVRTHDTPVPIWLKQSGISYFCGDLPEGEQQLVYATQGVPVPDLFDQKHDGVAWKTKPSWSIVAAEDRTVHPDLERFAAKRMGATTVELRSSHVPMLSQPRAVLDVIRDAAKTVEKSKAA